MLLPETEAYMAGLSWPGNVRQLENACRWLTVMAAGREVHIADLPPELLAAEQGESSRGDWVEMLRAWADSEVRRGNGRLLDTALPRFETAMIETALMHTRGRRGEAAELLGWGRNTLTRKIKELELTGLPDNGD